MNTEEPNRETLPVVLHLQPVSHNNDRGISDGAEQLLRSPLLFLPVVLLLHLQGAQTFHGITLCVLSVRIPCPCKGILRLPMPVLGISLQICQTKAGLSSLTLRDSFLVSFPPDAETSLSEPLYSFVSDCGYTKQERIHQQLNNITSVHLT